MYKILFLLLSGYLFFSCGHRQHGPQNNAASMAADSASLVYACPMDCEKGKTYAKAGQCPVCGMDLEAVTSAPASDNPNDPFKALSDETGAIHDEAMKEMAEMNRVSRQIKDFMQRAKMKKEEHDKYTAILADMEKAEEGMMTWMAQYQEPARHSEEDLQYLKDQKQKIAQSKHDIHAALEAGKSLLNK